MAEEKSPSARDNDIRVRIPTRLKEKLRAISQQRLLSMSDVAIEAIVELLKRYDESGDLLNPRTTEDSPQYAFKRRQPKKKKQ